MAKLEPVQYTSRLFIITGSYIQRNALRQLVQSSLSQAKGFGALWGGITNDIWRGRNWLGKTGKPRYRVGPVRPPAAGLPR